MKEAVNQNSKYKRHSHLSAPAGRRVPALTAEWGGSARTLAGCLVEDGRPHRAGHKPGAARLHGDAVRGARLCPTR